MDNIITVYVEGVLMDNGEVISYGRSLGYLSARQIELVKSGACKLTKGKEPIVALGKDSSPA